MKRLTLFLLCALLILTPLSVGAATLATSTTPPAISSTIKDGVTHYTEGAITYTIVKGEAIVTDYTRTEKGAVVVPDTLMGYPVTEIGEYAFYDCSYLTRVTLPDSVRRIGDYAFSLCVDMTAIRLGSGLQELGAGVFADTRSLTTIEVAADNPHFGVKQGALLSKDGTAFYHLPYQVATTTYTLPAGVTTIHPYALSGVSMLSCVILPDSVTAIGAYAFLGCGNLKQVVLSPNLTRIGDKAFFNCTRLQTVWYNGTDAQFAALEVVNGDDLLALPWKPIDADGLAALTPTNPKPTTTENVTTAQTTTPSKGEKDATTDPTPLPWLIAGVCFGLLIAVSAVLIVVLCRKKKK